MAMLSRSWLNWPFGFVWITNITDFHPLLFMAKSSASFLWVHCCWRTAKNSIIGDVFGLLSAVCYGLFTGRISIKFGMKLLLRFSNDNFSFMVLILICVRFSWCTQCSSRNLLDQEKRQIRRGCLVILAHSLCLAFGGLVMDITEITVSMNFIIFLT